MPEKVSIPFRVLVGFLRPSAGAGHGGSPRFNPFQGFGGVSAHAGGRPFVYRLPKGFNPFQGFGGVSAKARADAKYLFKLYVSIPFRVLVGFLLVMLGQEVVVQFEFQSLSGFWWGFCPLLRKRKAFT